jgi:hypothetical protein
VSSLFRAYARPTHTLSLPAKATPFRGVCEYFLGKGRHSGLAGLQQIAGHTLSAIAAANSACSSGKPSISQSRFSLAVILTRATAPISRGVGLLGSRGIWRQRSPSARQSPRRQSGIIQRTSRASAPAPANRVRPDRLTRGLGASGTIAHPS